MAGVGGRGEMAKCAQSGSGEAVGVLRGRQRKRMKAAESGERVGVFKKVDGAEKVARRRRVRTRSRVLFV